MRIPLQQQVTGALRNTFAQRGDLLPSATPRAWLAPALTAVTSVGLWAAGLAVNLPARLDRGCLDAAAVTSLAALAGVVSMQRGRDRAAYDRDRDAFVAALAARVTPQPGGDDVPARPEPDHPRGYLRVPA